MDNITLLNLKLFLIPTWLLFFAADCLMQHKASVDFIWSHVFCSSSNTFFYIVQTVAVFWKALTEVTTLCATGFRSCHTRRHLWASVGDEKLPGSCNRNWPRWHVSTRYTTGISPTAFWYRAVSECLHTALSTFWKINTLIKLFGNTNCLQVPNIVQKNKKAYCKCMFRIAI